jgi:hypothetical protein
MNNQIKGHSDARNSCLHMIHERYQTTLGLKRATFLALKIFFLLSMYYWTKAEEQFDEYIRSC